MTRYDELRRARHATCDDLRRVADRRESFRTAFIEGLAEYLGCDRDRLNAEFTEVRDELQFAVRLELGTEWAPLMLYVSFPPGKVVVSDRDVGIHFRVWEADLARGLQPVFTHVVERLAEWARSEEMARSK